MVRDMAPAFCVKKGVGEGGGVMVLTHGIATLSMNDKCRVSCRWQRHGTWIPCERDQW